MEKLGKHITALPENKVIDIVGKDTGELAIKANDVKYTEDRTYRAKGKGWNLQWIFIIFFVIFFLVMRPYNGGNGLIPFIIFGGISIFGFIYHYIAPIKHFTANRQKGTLQIPISKKKPQKVVKFDDGDGIIKSYYIDNLYTSLFFQTKKGVTPKAAMGLADWDREDYWNFLVWYMDKNRPLPPGKAFDPYREQDYERRKAAGFPKPLYPSDIKTPEATAMQQLERERIGGW